MVASCSLARYIVFHQVRLPFPGRRQRCDAFFFRVIRLALLLKIISLLCVIPGDSRLDRVGVWSLTIIILLVYFEVCFIQHVPEA